MIEIQYFAGNFEAYIGGTLIDYSTSLRVLLTKLAAYHSESLTMQMTEG